MPRGKFKSARPKKTIKEALKEHKVYPIPKAPSMDGPLRNLITEDMKKHSKMRKVESNPLTRRTKRVLRRAPKI